MRSNVFAHADNLGEMVDCVRLMLAPDGLFFFEARYLPGYHRRRVDRHDLPRTYEPSLGDTADQIPRSARAGTNRGRTRPHSARLVDWCRAAEGGNGGSRFIRQLLALEADRRLGELQTLATTQRTITGSDGRPGRELETAGSEDCGLWGRAPCGPTLISQLGLAGCDRIHLFRHPQKVGKFETGDGIPVVPTSELCKKVPDYTVILAWVHSQKIIETNPGILDKGGHLVVLCPETRIVGKNGDVGT